MQDIQIKFEACYYRNDVFKYPFFPVIKKSGVIFSKKFEIQIPFQNLDKILNFEGSSAHSLSNLSILDYLGSSSNFASNIKQT